MEAAGTALVTGASRGLGRALALELARRGFELTRRAIPSLRAAGGGVIVNVTSASLLFPMPFHAVYRASKAAVAAFGESLRAELGPFGIRVTEVLPGPVETDLLAGSDREPEAAACAGYEALARWAHEARRGMSGRTTPAAEAARRIADALLDDAAPPRVACDAVGAGMLGRGRDGV